MRLALGAFIGALVGFAAVFAWLETRPPDPHDLFGGTFFNLIGAGVLGAFPGLFFGAAAGWVWLVAAVGREARERATVAPKTPQEAASREETHRES